MSTPEHRTATQLPLLEPLLTMPAAPGNPVTKIYPIPSTPVAPERPADTAGEPDLIAPSSDAIAVLEEPIPDWGSVDTTTTYLKKRLDPPELVGEVQGGLETALGIPYPRFYSNGIRRVHAQGERVWRWLIRPEVAAVITAASLFGNAQPIAQAATYAVEITLHDIDQFLNPPKPTTITVPVTTPAHTANTSFSVQADMVDEAGSAVVNPADVEQFAEEVAAVEATGGTVRAAFTADESDEWAAIGDSAIGVATEENVPLGEERDENTEAEFKEDMDRLHEPVPEIVSRSHESVISEKLKGELVNEAHAAGYETLTEAIVAEDDSVSLPKKLARQIKAYFVSKRGVRMVGNSTEPEYIPSSTVYTPKYIPATNSAPKPGRFHWHWPSPIPPIPRRWGRRNKGEEVSERIGWDFLPIPIPLRVQPKANEIWVRLREDAVINYASVYGDPQNERGNRGRKTYLAPVPFALTRKAMHLGREGLYDSVLQARYQDPSGAERITRIIFVGQHPSPAALEKYDTILKRAVASKDSQIGKTISIIMIYPTKDAGVEHNDPSRIAIGIDNQQPDVDVQAETTPDVELIEIHIADLDDTERVREVFEGVSGGRAVFGHEGVHAMAAKRGPTRVRKLRNSTIPNAYIPVGNRFQGHPMGRLLQLRMRDLEQGYGGLHRTRFQAELSSPTRRNPDRVITRRIRGDDPRMYTAKRLQIIGTKHTHYSNTSEQEHAAEAGAFALTGERAEVSQEFEVPTRSPLLYEPDRRVQRRMARFLKAAPGKAPLNVPGSNKVTTTFIEKAEDDELIRMIMQSARQHEVPEPDDMITVLAGVWRAVEQRQAREKVPV